MLLALTDNICKIKVDG